MNYDERNRCVFTQMKVFRSLEAVMFTYHVTLDVIIFGVRHVRLKM